MHHILVLEAQHGPSIPFLLADNICAGRELGGRTDKYFISGTKIFLSASSQGRRGGRNMLRVRV